ncbi:hypothetical protein PTI45_04642 [Paenibacillus nuruki]|uniref:DNA-binding protein n=1 Tax=Paenibacillus nuruki TaxID=1886670 RepID=A0A1E3KXB4_9BACL|nr:hypothetical protein [Paenibacillus nuruki]ODP26033.1 hypothetical protein PTI45_04642 [Paenibacillus nuruki]
MNHNSNETYVARDIVGENILFTAEVSDLLQCNVMEISNYVKEKVLIPIKRTSNAMLFFKPDVLKLKTRLENKKYK